MSAFVRPSTAKYGVSSKQCELFRQLRYLRCKVFFCFGKFLGNSVRLLSSDVDEGLTPPWPRVYAPRGHVSAWHRQLKIMSHNLSYTIFAQCKHALKVTENSENVHNLKPCTNLPKIWKILIHPVIRTLSACCIHLSVSHAHSQANQSQTNHRVRAGKAVVRV